MVIRGVNFEELELGFGAEEVGTNVVVDALVLVEAGPLAAFDPQAENNSPETATGNRVIANFETLPIRRVVIRTCC